MTSISMRAIKKNFGETRVLSGIDLTIEAGEFLTLVGPSGCGKSTLLRILAGLEAPSFGDIVIDGNVVNRVRPAERNLAMVFQSYALYPHLSVEDNMMTPLRLRDLSFTERLPLVGPLSARGKYRALKAQVKETAETLKIDHLLARKPGQLSGGQRQRAALGRAMVRKPVAFLMDEPLSNLDAALRVHMRSELAELHRSLNATFVYVTHDQAEALTMSDRMAVMMDGQILQLGTPDEIYNDPHEVRVAEFIGSPKINLLPGLLDERGQARCEDVVLSRTASGKPGKITIGLRPEHLSLGDAGESGTLTGRVIHKENLGADVYIHIGLFDGTQRVVFRVTPAEGSDISFGQEVSCKRHRGAALVFDEAGQRIGLAERQENSVPEVA